MKPIVNYAPPSAKMNYLYLWEINKVIPVVKNTLAATAGPDAVVVNAHGEKTSLLNLSQPTHPYRILLPFKM